MNLPPYADRAAQLLRRGSNATSPAANDDRDRGVQTIERALTARYHRRLWTRVLAASAVAAGLAGLWLNMNSWAEPRQAPAAAIRLLGSETGAGAVLSDANGSRPLGAGSKLSLGSRVVAKDKGGAVLSLSSGTTLSLDGNASFAVQGTGPTQRFSLQFGGLFAKVAKLEPGQRFLVDTPDAAVEVRGTAFKLTVLAEPEACNEETRTRLRVSEGLVTVYANGTSSHVAAGQFWPPECDPSRQIEAKPSASAVSSARPPQKRAALAQARATDQQGDKPAERKASSLTEQNDLFAEAVRARSSGDRGRALGLYARFEATYPRSPLAQNASVERMRLLMATDRSAARQQAQRYLERYPHGFALAEAKRLLGEP